MATTTPAFTAKYAVLTTSKTATLSTGLLDLGLNYGAVTTVGQNIQYVGSALVDAVFLRPGVSIDFTASGAGIDKLYVGGNLADYTLKVVGKNVSLSRTVNGQLESATVAVGDTVVFANGSVGTQALFDYASNKSQAPVPGNETSVNPSVPIGDGVSPTVSMTGLNKTGVTFASGLAGVALVVKGTAGVDNVYVKTGTQVDASGLGAGVDNIYFTGNYAEYTKEVVKGNLVFKRTVNGTAETVTLAGKGDRAVFADGSVLTDSIAKAPTAPTPAGWDASTQTPTVASDVSAITLDVANSSKDTKGKAKTLYKQGDELVFNVKFAKDVDVDAAGGKPQLALLMGNKTVYATYDGALTGSSKTDIKFKYKVQADDLDNNGISVLPSTASSSAISLNGGAINLTGTSTPAAIMQTPAMADVATAKVDGVAPVITASYQVDENTLSDKVLKSVSLAAGEAVTWLGLSGPDAAAFTLGSGKLLFKGATNYEMQSSYNVTLTGVDAAGNASTQELIINLRDVAEAPVVATPLVNQFFATGSTYTIPSTAFKDEDAGSTLTYMATLANGKVLPTWLSFDASTGTFTAVGSPVPVKGVIAPVTVRVTATDGTKQSATSDFTIKWVVSAPVVQSLSVIDADGDALGKAGEALTLTLKLSQAVTSSTGLTATFTMGGKEVTATLAAIDSANATNTLTFTDVNVPQGANGMVSLKKLVADNGGTIKSTNGITLIAPAVDAIVDTNYTIDTSTPTITATYSVAENTSTDTATKTIALVADKSLTWSGLSGADAGAFTLNADGTLSFKNASNFEAKSVYKVSVTGTDVAGNAATQAITINLSDVNEAPTAITLSANTIAENVTVGTGVEVGTLTVSDPDASGNNNVLSLDGVDKASFQIRTSNGVSKLYYVGTSPNYGTKSSYAVTVTSTDGSLVKSQTFTVNVTNVNEVPTAITLSANTIAENVTVSTGVEVGTLTVSDPDASGNNNVLSLDGVDKASFQIRTSNGVSKLYYVGTSPNYGTKSSYAVTVTSTDGSLVKSQTFTVNVTNVNEVPTAITLSANTIAENVTVGTGVEVGTLTVSDPDASGNNNVLSLDGVDKASFQIRTSNGVSKLYYVGTSPNYGTKSSYAVTVTSTDGSLVKSQTFTVNVTNVNEVPTAITLSANTIAENVTVGTGVEVGTLTVSDPDASGNNNVLSLDGVDKASFQIRTSNGVSKLYYVGTSPNYESKGSYAVTVTSTDGSLVKSQAFTVNVSNVEEAPVGMSTTLTLEMNSSRSFTAADFGLQNSDGNSLREVQIISLPVNGILKFNGFNVMAKSWIPAPGLGLLVYTPKLGATGSAYDRIGFVVRDTGSLIDGGQNTEVRKALNLDGSNDYADLGILSLGGAVTLEAWVKADVVSSNARIFDLGNGQGVDNIVLTQQYFYVLSGGTQIGRVNIPTTVMKAGVWSHVAVTVEANRIASVYVDGNLVGAGVLSADLPTLSRSKNYVGKSNWAVDPYLDGQVADVRIYSDARSVSEIRADMGGALDRSDTNLVRAESFDGQVAQAELVNGPTYTARINQLKLDVTGGRIFWGDGSGYGNTGVAGISPDGGGDDDQLQGTGQNDILFGDGSGGGQVGGAAAGKGGAGNDVLYGGAGNDLLFGDGFTANDLHGGYGGGGGGATAWYGAAGVGGLGAGKGYGNNWARGEAAWLGPMNLGTDTQARWLGQSEDNWTGGAGVRSGNVLQGLVTDALWADLASAAASSVAAYGGRSVYNKVLWDLSQGSGGFGTGHAAADAAGTGNSGTNVDQRLYSQKTGSGRDVLRGGQGSDWLMGGGGVDAFEWTHDDMDGSTDYVVDFAPSLGEKLRLVGALKGYQQGSDIAQWVRLDVGQTSLSPFEGGAGVYSRVRIDVDGLGQFDAPEQTILFRGDPLFGFTNPQEFIDLPKPVGLPQATGVEITAGRYEAGQRVEVRLKFDQVVDVMGLDVQGGPALRLGNGSQAEYVSGAGSDTLVFEFSVTPQTPYAARLQVEGIDFKGAQILNAQGVWAEINWRDVPQPQDVVVDTRARIETLHVTTGTFDLGDQVFFDLVFDRDLTLTSSGRWDLLLNSGDVAQLVSVQGRVARFAATISAQSRSVDDLQVTGFSLDGAVLADSSGQTSTPVWPDALVHQGRASVQMQSTQAVSVSFAGGIYAAESVVPITLHFDHAVNVDLQAGSPTLMLSNGVSARYVSGAGTKSLVFEYKVQSTDTASEDLRVVSLQNNGAVLQDATGDAPVMASLAGFSDSARVLVFPTSVLPNKVQLVSNAFHDIARGKANANATVELFLDDADKPWQSVQANADGWWEVKLDPVQEQHMLRVRQLDAQGLVSQTTEAAILPAWVYVPTWGDDAIGGTISWLKNVELVGTGDVREWAFSNTKFSDGSPWAPSADYRMLLEHLLQQTEDVILRDYVEVAPGTAGALRVGVHPGHPSGGYANASIVSISDEQVVGQINPFGGYFPTLRHEFYHSLGLPDYPAKALSFFTAFRGAEGSYDLSLYDVAAVQWRFGANWATRTGDDVYKYSPDILPQSLIWDGGGNDTIDASANIKAVTLSLMPGMLNQGFDNFANQEVQYMKSAIAFCTLIENAIGSAYADDIVGNPLNNRLEGGAGNDLLKGRAGDDVIIAGAGDDVIRGGTGADVLSGGEGADRFLFASGLSKLEGVGTRDLVQAYAQAEHQIVPDRDDYRQQDADGSTDVIEDFTLDTDHIVLDSVLQGYRGAADDLSRWVQMTTSVRQADGSYASVLLIDREGAAQFAQPDLRLVLVGDPLNGLQSVAALRTRVLQMTDTDAWVQINSSQYSGVSAPVISGTAKISVLKLKVTVDDAVYEVFTHSDGRWSLDLSTAQPLSGTFQASKVADHQVSAKGFTFDAQESPVVTQTLSVAAQKPSLSFNAAYQAALKDGVVTVDEVDGQVVIGSVQVSTGSRVPVASVTAVLTGQSGSLVKVFNTPAGEFNLGLSAQELRTLGVGDVSIDLTAQDLLGAQAQWQQAQVFSTSSVSAFSGHFVVQESADPLGTRINLSLKTLGAGSFLDAPDQVLFTVSGLENGGFFLQNQPVLQFTQADVESGLVSFRMPLSVSASPIFTLAMHTPTADVGPQSIAVTYQALSGGKIVWGDGSGYGNTGLPGISANGGGDDDWLQGTGHNDILFGDGSAGGKVLWFGAGLAGSGNDIMRGGDGHDILFGDGFASTDLNGGYGGGGGGETTWYGSGGVGGLGAGKGYGSASSRGEASWLGPLNQGTDAQAFKLGLSEDNWTGGAGVRAGNVDEASMNDQVANVLTGAASKVAAYGDRSVYDKVLWDLSQGTTGFGTGNAAADSTGVGNGGANVDQRLYSQSMGTGQDVLRGGKGSDWLMGGGGADAFVWADQDMDGSSDYLVDFNAKDGDVLRFDATQFVGYGVGQDLGRWFKAESGLTHNSPFEGGQGTYSRVLIDLSGQGQFQAPNQTIYFRGDALSSVSLSSSLELVTQSWDAQVHVVLAA